MDSTKSQLKAEPERKNIYKVGAIAAFLAAIIFRRNWSAEASVILSLESPSSALEWFALIQENRLLGLIMMNFFDMVNNALVGIIFFALYFALKDTNEIYMKFANILCFVGIAVHIASNQTFAMLSLSDRYFEALAVDKPVFLAAGEAIIAINNQGSGLYASMFLIGFSGLMISLIMLQSTMFGRKTAYIGILANGIGLCYFITMIIIPTIGWITIPLSAIPLLIWYILIGVKLLS